MDWGLFVKGHGGKWVLRTNRLYPSKRFYWCMVVINTMLRFCWTLSFIPLSYLSATGVLTETFSSSSWSNVLGPLIASAEILRRSLWGLLRVEWEIVKNVDNDDESEEEEKKGGFEMIPMQVSTATLDGRAANGPSFSDMSAMDSTQLLVELSIYTSTFAVLGLLIAAHRGTL
jgi:EXS family